MSIAGWVKFGQRGQIRLSRGKGAEPERVELGPRVTLDDQRASSVRAAYIMKSRDDILGSVSQAVYLTTYPRKCSIATIR